MCRKCNEKELCRIALLRNGNATERNAMQRKRAVRKRIGKELWRKVEE